jgi:putative Ca2+/H+ antiporter (TMEM165/GDT1 family)
VGTPAPGLGSKRARVDKTPAIAFVLTLLFGPLGLLYVKVAPALLLLAVAVGGYAAFGTRSKLALAVSVVVWVVSIVWACVEASRRHAEFQRWRASTGAHGVPLPGREQAAALAYFPGQDAPLPPPGWYPDAADATKVRWWDGSRWTGDAQPPAQ